MKRLFTTLIAILLAVSSLTPAIALDGTILQYDIATQADSTYVLQDSVVLGGWSDDYLHYNAYGYVLGLTETFYEPGLFSGYEHHKDYALATMVFHVIEDLKCDELGYKCVRITSDRPTSVAAGESCFCFRKGPRDFHMMKLVNGAWYHKPANTIPLRYKYVPSNDRVWTNEGVLFDEVMKPHLTYDSDIVYFLYKQEHGTLTYTWTEEHYHSGSMHYYKYGYKCADCNDFDNTTWISMPCTTGSCLTPWSVGQGHEVA